MRDIKFRAWDKNTAEWLYAELTTHSSLNTTRLIHSSEWLQYTGLKDKNGVEIYEGDIVAYDDLDCSLCDEDEEPIVVSYYDQGAGFVFGDTAFSFIDCINHDHREHFEVIGNIYENPELVK